LEDPPIRRARGIVWSKIKEDPSKKTEQWWKTNPELEDAASTVCASYDIVARLIKGDKHLTRFFATAWAHSICWTHETLDKFLDYRADPTVNTGADPDAYSGYRRLYAIAETTQRGNKANDLKLGHYHFESTLGEGRCRLFSA
jgi:hypothetical protein